MSTVKGGPPMRETGRDTWAAGRSREAIGPRCATRLMGSPTDSVPSRWVCNYFGTTVFSVPHRFRMGPLHIMRLYNLSTPLPYLPYELVQDSQLGKDRPSVDIL